MRGKGPIQTSICVLVVVSFLTVSCAGLTPGETLGCAAVGAAAGGVIGGATSGDWKWILIGAGTGAVLGALTCIAIAESQSRQVKDYQETRQAVKYEPSQGDIVQITNYTIMPAATAPGTEVVFNATYYVMTANADQEVAIKETRILKVHDYKTGGYREIGKAETPVTMKPGTRQADGKFQVRSRVPEGNYLLIFQVAKNGVSDTKELSLTVTQNPAILGAASSRIAQVVAEGAKGSEAPVATPPAPAAPKPAEQESPTATSPTPGTPLARLGEREPKPPAPPAVAPVPALPEPTKVGGEKARYFLASKVAGKGNLREGPGTTHRIVGEIKEGERFLIIGRTQKPGDEAPWYKIRLDSGLEAWVAGSLGTEVQE